LAQILGQPCGLNFQVAGGAPATGDVLFARFGGRGVAAAAELAARWSVSMRVVLRRRAAGHIQADSFSQRCFAPEMLSPLSPAQRTLLSIPAVGHEFWTGATATATAARYAGWDAAPYREAIAPGGDDTETAAAPPETARGGRRGGSRWAHPTAANPQSEATAVLRPEQVAQWHERGFLVVDGIWPRELIAVAAAAAAELQVSEAADSTAEDGDPTAVADSQFPHESSVLNDVVLHPRVLAMVRQLVGGPAEFYGDVLLRKWGDEAGRGEQFAHLDMGNHTSLAVAPEPESVAAIVFSTVPHNL
jgi:hypothetical protein